MQSRPISGRRPRVCLPKSSVCCAWSLSLFACILSICESPLTLAEDAFKNTLNLGEFVDTLKGLIEAKQA